jgi:outer membrane protein insertion porin family
LKITLDTLLKPHWAALALGLWLALAGPVTAQEPALPPVAGAPAGSTPAAAPAGQATPAIVEEISIRLDRPQEISSDSVRAHIMQQEKAPYDQELIDKSIESLYSTGDFDFIRTERVELPTGGVRVDFYLFPKARVSAVLFKGNKEYSQSRLTEEIKTVAGEALNPSQLKQDKDALITFYQKAGYSQVKVDTSVDTNENTGKAVVTYTIDEGPSVVISVINFTGNDHIDAGTLRDQIETSKYTYIISWITGSGRFEKDKFLDDLDTLRKYYKSQGYLDIDIEEDEIKYENPTPGRLVITIPVHEGRQYHIGKNITVSGNTIFRSETLLALLTIKPGDVFAPEEVDKNSTAIKDYYGKAGYLDTIVEVERKPNLDTGDIGLDFVILHPVNNQVVPGESEKSYVEGIDIQGNTKTKSEVILRELSLAPGDVFNTDRMQTSEDKLKSYPYFETVNLSPEDTTIPGKRNLRIDVTEARTLSATFGAGFDPVEGALAYIQFEESNFDLFNYRTNFRGGGQKALIKLTLGSELSGIEIDYEYPWLFERRLDAGVSLFHTESSYYSTTYNEDDTGATFWVAKPIIEFITANVSYTVENIEIKDITTAAPPPIQQEAGNTGVSKIALDLVREKDMDSAVSPTTGQRQELLQEVAGGPLGGQTNFYRIEGHATWWFPTFGYRTQVLTFAVRGGTITGYDGKDVPYAERYFLGGDYNLRGYAYRQVGPLDTNPGDPAVGQPLGGNTFGVMTTEYSIVLFGSSKDASDFRFEVFHDIGFVNSNSFDFTVGGYQQDVGFGFKFHLLKAPLRIDLGYPLNPNQYQSHSIQFNFSGSFVY